MKILKVSTDGKTRIFHFEGNKEGLMKKLEEQKNEELEVQGDIQAEREMEDKEY